MEPYNTAIAILWVFLFLYSIMGSVDFGAGFWGYVYGERGDTGAGGLANRFLSPSWKITNVFLVLFVVALVGFFPRAAFLLGALLLLPVSLVLVLLTLRSAFMVFSYSVPEIRRWTRLVSGWTGLLIPALLVSVLPVTLGGFIDVSGSVPQLVWGELLASPTLYAHLAFGLATELYLSALFLADYADEAGDASARAIYRNWAVRIGPFTLASALLTTYTMVPEAAWMVNNMEARWPWFALSLAAFFVGYAALRRGALGRPDGIMRLAMVATVLQYAFASIGYGGAHLPYIVFPHMTVEEAFTNPVMYRSLIWGYTIGSLILIPAFVWFWKLFLKDVAYLKKD